jgi:hypothetical protein
MFTPKGLSVIARQRSISALNAAGVGWVSAVRMPRPPAFDTAAREFGVADALHPALDDRMFDFQHFGDACLESHSRSFSAVLPLRHLRSVHEIT